VPPPVPPPATSTPEAHVAVPSPRDVAPPLSPPAAVSLSSTPIRRASSVAPSLPSSATVPETSPWVVAAKAMRSGDYATAERAFEQLATSSDPQPRDEARLARAQVWLAEGRVSEARPELSTLAATGATSLVRQRAADALRKIDDSSKP
jgi:thioredoxin-like negative regulator of GroEL